MIDFLKANPFVTKEEYIWKWSVPQIRLASRDFTHLNYLSEEQAKKKAKKKKVRRIDSPLDLTNDLGIPVL